MIEPLTRSSGRQSLTSNEQRNLSNRENSYYNNNPNFYLYFIFIFFIHSEERIRAWGPGMGIRGSATRLAHVLVALLHHRQRVLLLR